MIRKDGEIHELSLVEGLLEIVNQEALQNNAKRVLSVQVEIGLISGVEKGAVEFCYPLCARGTLAEGSELQIEVVMVLARCNLCEEEFPSEEHLFWCPQCESPDLEILRGREFKVKTMEIE